MKYSEIRNIEARIGEVEWSAFNNAWDGTDALEKGYISEAEWYFSQSENERAELEFLYGELDEIFGEPEVEYLVSGECRQARAAKAVRRRSA